MGLMNRIAGFFGSKSKKHNRNNQSEKTKNKNLDAALQTFQGLMCPELKKPLLPTPVYSNQTSYSDEVFYLDYSTLKKPAIDKYLVSPDDIVNQYYGDLDANKREKIAESIGQDQNRLYLKLTGYDLRAIEYRKRTERMSDLEKRKYRSEILRQSEYLKAA